jgi:hypothetical protein
MSVFKQHGAMVASSRGIDGTSFDTGQYEVQIPSPVRAAIEPSAEVAKKVPGTIVLIQVGKKVPSSKYLVPDTFFAFGMSVSAG